MISATSAARAIPICALMHINILVWASDAPCSVIARSKDRRISVMTRKRSVSSCSSDRKSVVKGKSVSVCVDLGGIRNMKKYIIEQNKYKNTTKQTRQKEKSY